MKSFKQMLFEMKRPRWEVPAEPGSKPAPEGKIKLYHQTSEKSLNGIRKHGIELSRANGYEGPKAIYASPPDSKNRGFYGPAHSTPTAEFDVDKHEYQAPFVHKDVVPAKDVTAHKEWHSTVRYIDADPDLRKAVEAGEHDDLMKQGKKDKFAKAVRFVKKRMKAKLTESREIRKAKKLARQYQKSLSPEAKAGSNEYKSGNIRNCTTGNCAWHAKNFVDFAKSKGVKADAISMQNQKDGGDDHIAARVGNTVIDPTHYQFTKRKPNRRGAQITQMKDFDKNYGKHGYRADKTMTASVSTIEKTPYEQGGTGGPLTYQAPRKK